MTAFKRVGCLLTLWAALFVPSIAQRFHDIPENRWVFETLLKFRNANLTEGFPDGILRYTPDRQQVASYVVYIHGLLNENFESINSQFESISKRAITYGEWQKQIEPVSKRIDWFAGLSKDVMSLVRMTEVFGKELRELEIDPEEIAIELKVLMTRNAILSRRISFSGEQRELQFSDVPGGHWVYDALEEGRNRQFFFGYPDELFRGANALTRYELAGAINAFYQEVRQQVMGLEDQYSSRNSFPGGPQPSSLAEMARSLARFNWVLKHRRELIQFASRF